MTRFAGNASIGSYLSDSPDMGALAQKGAMRNAQRQAEIYGIESELGGLGATQLGDTLAAKAVGEAQANLAGAQQKAQMMGEVGSLLGQGIGGLGSMGSSYGGFGSSGLNSGGKYGMAFDPSSVEAAMNTYGGYGS